MSEYDLSFEIPKKWQQNQSGATALSSRDQKAFTLAAIQLAQTDEGLKLLKNTKQHGDGVINLFNISKPVNNILTGARPPNDITLNEVEDILRYKGTDEKFHDVSTQRVLFHELCHLMGKDERGAIIATNGFMEKYYNEVPRVLDPSQVDFKGRPLWDINWDFKKERYTALDKTNAAPEAGMAHAAIPSEHSGQLEAPHFTAAKPSGPQTSRHV